LEDADVVTHHRRLADDHPRTGAYTRSLLSST
jgi:hypothetical protein